MRIAGLGDKIPKEKYNANQKNMSAVQSEPSCAICFPHIIFQHC